MYSNYSFKGINSLKRYFYHFKHIICKKKTLFILLCIISLDILYGEIQLRSILMFGKYLDILKRITFSTFII